MIKVNKTIHFKIERYVPMIFQFHKMNLIRLNGFAKVAIFKHSMYFVKKNQFMFNMFIAIGKYFCS